MLIITPYVHKWEGGGKFQGGDPLSPVLLLLDTLPKRSSSLRLLSHLQCFFVVNLKSNLAFRPKVSVLELPLFKPFQNMSIFLENKTRHFEYYFKSQKKSLK